MEKLLLHIKIKGGKHAGNLSGQRTKIFSLAVDGYENIFAKHMQTTKNSTLFRMNYLHQPIQGLLLKITQLFSGRVKINITNSSSLTLSI